MVRRRPLSVWKKLLKIIGEQPFCHDGEPQYEHLYSYLTNTTNKAGPEPSNIPGSGENAQNPGYGRHTQGGAMEHLSHGKSIYMCHSM